MAVAGSKVIQRIDLHHRSSNIDGISWSKDNRLSVATYSFVTIINITGVHAQEKKKESRLKIKRSAIASESKPEEVDVDIDFFEKRLAPFSTAPYYSTALLDPALSPTIMKQTCYEDVTYAIWSPVGCDQTGRSVLAVLFRTNKLALYIADKRSLYGWCEILDISAKHYEEMKTGKYFKDKSSLKGEIPPDARSTLGEKDIWTEFGEWQRRKYLVNFTCIEWYPAVVSCLQHSNNTTRKFAFLATMVKSGQLLIWQAQLPLVKNHCFIYRAVAAYTSMFHPSCMAWHGVSDEKVSYLACGNTDGIIKVFLIKITPTNVGLPNIAIVKAYSFLEVPDDVSVDCITWYNKGDKLYLACSKGPHVTLFHTQVMKEGTLSKPVKQIITGIHLLNVTGIAISSSGMLFSASAEGSVQQFQIGSRVRSTAMDCDTLPGHGYSGVSVSPNGVFMALFECRRKLFHYKKEASAIHGDVVIISLVSKEENVQELMLSTSSIVDIGSIRNRFIYQELSKPELSDSMDLPAVLKGFSQAYLQFLWNLFSSNPKFKKFTGDGSVELGSHDATSGENSDELQSIYRIEKIEKQVATLAMEKALIFILKYHEGKRRITNTPVSGDKTVKTICHWLAQRNPSGSVIDLLRKVWTICNPVRAATVSTGMRGSTPGEQPPGKSIPSEPYFAEVTSDNERQIDMDVSSQGSDGAHRYSDICQVILGSSSGSESCMCGQPITLKEVRFGRCLVGHIWPRCCVTFKLLDGTNCRVCENCNAHALNVHPINSPYADWTKHLLDVASSCTYCGAWFEEV